MNPSVNRSVERVGLASRSSESQKPRTDGRTDGLTKNWETERTSGTFRNAHTRVPDFAADEVPQPSDVDLQVKDAALGAVRILGREVRALRARLAEAEER